MSNSTKRLLTIILLSLIGFASQHVISSAQELEGREGNSGGRGSYRQTQPQTFFQLQQTGEQAGIVQFNGRAGMEAPAEPARETIALAVWVLTVDESGAPENEELVGKLVEKVRSLPAVVGSIDEVNDLIRRLKAAGLIQKSRELRLMSLDGQSVTAQVGTNRPKIIATSVSGQPQSRSRRMRGGVDAAIPDGEVTDQLVAAEPIVTNSINYEQVGNLVELTPRINADATLNVNFSYNASESEKEPTVTLSEIPGREPLTAEKTVTNQVHSQIRMRSGTAVVVQSDSTLATEGTSSTAKTNLILLGARVIPELAAPKTGGLDQKPGPDSLDAERAVDLAPKLLPGPEN